MDKLLRKRKEMVLKQPVIQSTSTSSAQALSKYEPIKAIERSISNGLRQAQSDNIGFKLAL